jgi:hypothetical protein
MANAKTEAGGDDKSQPKKPLDVQYPVSSTWELTLENNETFQGEVYCTDPISQLVVLQDQLSDIRMVSVSSIQSAKQLKEASGEDTITAGGNLVHTKKALEEREKRAIRLAQESFRHINPKVSGLESRKGSGLYQWCPTCFRPIWRPLLPPYYISRDVIIVAY